jgi:hypothetical protein
MRRLLLVLPILAACQATVTRVGRPYSSKSPDCDIAFDYRDQQSGMRLLTDFIQIGSVELPHTRQSPTYTDAMKQKLRPQACQLGGDLVAYDHSYDVTGDALANATNGSPWGVFVVYRRKSP